MLDGKFAHIDIIILRARENKRFINVFRSFFRKGTFPAISFNTLLDFSRWNEGGYFRDGAPCFVAWNEVVLQKVTFHRNFFVDRLLTVC